MIGDYLTLLGFLVLAHLLLDFPLQGDFMAKAKNPRSQIPGVPWRWMMRSHAALHAGGVWLITGVWWLGVIEFVLHFTIDTLKCNGDLTFEQDQLAHLALKAAYAAIVVFGGLA